MRRFYAPGPPPPPRALRRRPRPRGWRSSGGACTASAARRAGRRRGARWSTRSPRSTRTSTASRPSASAGRPPSARARWTLATRWVAAGCDRGSPLLDEERAASSAPTRPCWPPCTSDERSERTITQRPRAVMTPDGPTERSEGVRCSARAGRRREDWCGERAGWVSRLGRAPFPDGAPGHGDREPHPGLVLRPGRDVRRGRGAGAGGARSSRRAPTSSTSAGSRPGPATRSTPRRRSGAPSPFVAAVRAALPRPGDQRRHLARTRSAGRCCAAGADLLNDAWGGVDPRLAEVAAEFGAGLVCTHAGGATPRAPARTGVAYDDVIADVARRDTVGARRARRRGSACAATGCSSTPATTSARTPGTRWRPPGGSTRWSRTGWPVLVSLSNKDFVGETLDRAARRSG